MISWVALNGKNIIYIIIFVNYGVLKKIHVSRMMILERLVRYVRFFDVACVLSDESEDF